MSFGLFIIRNSSYNSAVIRISYHNSIQAKTFLLNLSQNYFPYPIASISLRLSRSLSIQNSCSSYQPFTTVHNLRQSVAAETSTAARVSGVRCPSTDDPNIDYRRSQCKSIQRLNTCGSGIDSSSSSHACCRSSPPRSRSRSSRPASSHSPC